MFQREADKAPKEQVLFWFVLFCFVFPLEIVANIYQLSYLYLCSLFWDNKSSLARVAKILKYGICFPFLD